MPRRAPIHRPLKRSQQVAGIDALRRDTDRRRGSSTQRGYDYQWQKLRKAKLDKDPLCECDDCAAGAKRTRLATVVDHIIAIEVRPELRLVWSNLRSMTKSCHDKHTARTRGFGRGGVGERL